MRAPSLKDLAFHPDRYTLTDRERAFIDARSKSLGEKHAERFRCLKNVVASADERKRLEQLAKARMTR